MADSKEEKAIVVIQSELDQCYGDLVILKGFFEAKAEFTEIMDDEDVSHLIDSTAKLVSGICKNVRAALDAVNDIA